MSSIAIVADSTAGLAPEFAEQHNVRIVPLYLKIGDTTYRDGLDITVDEFYSRLPKCDPLPVTSQPSAGDFVAAYRDLVEGGATGIISIHISSALSGTVNSAKVAADEFPGTSVEIVDTLTVAAAHQLVVEATVAAVESGASLEEAVAAAQRAVGAVRIVFTVDTLEYLYKGGRIGGAAALLGSVLQFKPLLYFAEGKIDALERVRTSKRALRRIVEVMAEWMGSEEPLQAVVMHAACRDRADALAEVLPQHLKAVNVQIVDVPAVLGVHGGNGTLGLACCPVSAYGGGPAGSAV